MVLRASSVPTVKGLKETIVLYAMLWFGGVDTVFRIMLMVKPVRVPVHAVLVRSQTLISTYRL